MSYDEPHSLNFKGLENLITIVMSKLVGKVNKNFICIGFSFNYDPYAKIMSSERFGDIQFNIIPIARNYINASYKELKAYIIMICAHELSHIDQNCDYYKDGHNPIYAKWIEQTNEEHTKAFLYNNMKLLVQELGEFDENVIYSKYDHIDSGSLGYQIQTNSERIKSIILTLCSSKELVDMDHYSFVLLRIYNEDKDPIVISIKEDGKYVADVEELSNLLFDIELEYQSVNWRISIDTNGDPNGIACINLYLEKNAKKLIKIVEKLSDQDMILNK